MCFAIPPCLVLNFPGFVGSGDGRAGDDADDGGDFYEKPKIRYQGDAVGAASAKFNPVGSGAVGGLLGVDGVEDGDGSDLRGRRRVEGTGGGGAGD